MVSVLCCVTLNSVGEAVLGNPVAEFWNYCLLSAFVSMSTSRLGDRKFYSWSGHTVIKIIPTAIW